MKVKKKESINKMMLGFEIIIFFLSTTGLAYFAGKGQWNDFGITAFILLIIFIIFKWIEHNPKLLDSIYFDTYLSKITSSAIDSGLIEFYNMQNVDEQDKRNKDCRDLIDKADDMFLCANSGASYLDSAISRHWSSIEKRLNIGKNFKVVLLDPFSENKKQRNSLNVKGDSYDSKLDISNLINLSNKYSNLEIKFIKNGMHSTIFATKNELFFDPYHIGVIGTKIENKTFCLKFQMTENERDLYTIFMSHFNTLWKNGIELKEWLIENKSQLDSTLPILNK
ncbi:hypothetical protein [Aliarcobacter butzleri]|uniref:hypothetical protein n=1 Tax=Aliarcobacter butzleri TaxID=28197 RepID=UPI002B2462E4|nr:hypothetical protein [Aliarcobacter butzleri]